MYGATIESMQSGVQRLAETFRQMKPELGEYSLPNVYAQIPCSSTTREKESTMARPASKEKTLTIGHATVRKISAWGVDLEALDFEVNSFQFNGAGDIVSATCTKNDREQVITPELKAMLGS